VVTDHALYLALGNTPQERQQAYQVLCQGQLDADLLQEIRATLQQGRILGTERFKDSIEAALARRVRPGKAGRPRKGQRPQETANATETSDRGLMRMARTT
jgi:putative transposase